MTTKPAEATQSDREQPLVTSRPATIAPLLNWAMWCLDETKNAIREGCFDLDAETFADKAVELGLIRQELFDPAKHGEIDADDGDMIYCWDNRLPPSANQQTASS